MNKGIPARITALILMTLLLLFCAATAGAELKPYAGGLDRISIDIPEYIKLVKEPYLETTAHGMTVLHAIIDTEKTDWNAVAMHAPYRDGGDLYDIHFSLHAPKNAGVAKHYSANTSYSYGEDNLTSLEWLNEALQKCKDEVGDSLIVGNGTCYARYSTATGKITTFTTYSGWENYYQATNVQWLDADGKPVGDAEVLLFHVACDKAKSISVSVPRIPAQRLYGGVSISGSGNIGLYPSDVVGATIEDGDMYFTVPDTSKLVENQIYAAIATPDGKDGWTCSYTWPNAGGYTVEARIVETDAITGSSQNLAFINHYISSSEGTFSSVRIVTFTKGGQSETMRLDLTAKCGTVGEGKPWLYYTDWTPVTNCALPWNNPGYDFGFPDSLKEPGWYHFEMEEEGAMPSADVMAEPEIYRPVVFGPAGAAYYKWTGSSIMRNAYFSDVSDMVEEDEEELALEDYSPVEGPMRAANFPGVVWPMEPKELELEDGTVTTVCLPSFYAGEETINYFIFRWYDENYNELRTDFLLCTTDTFYDYETTKAETVMPTDKREYPVLVLNHGPQEEYTLVIETYPQTNSDNSVYYELSLIDENGNHVSFDGKTRMELLIPYPDGYTQEELEALEYAVTHYDDRHNVKESFGKNKIKIQKNGIVIEVFDLSPFLVSWKEAEPEPTAVPDTSNLPKTGDHSQLFFMMLLGCASVAAIMLLRRKHETE